MDRPRRTAGLVIEGQDISAQEVVERARMAEKAGVDSIWLVQLPTLRDSATILAALAMSTETVRLGAGILPYYTRPPVVMAQTAAAIDELSGGRFVLGVGTGHNLLASWMTGKPSGPPVAVMRDYLTTVTTLLRTGEVHTDGEWYQAHAVYNSPRRPDLPVYLGAFGPSMCRLAGEVADGLLLWMCTSNYLRDVALPHLHEGLRRAGRDPATFPVTVAVPGMVSGDLEGDRAVLRKYLSTYARVPNYRRMYEASGFADAVHSREIGDDLLDNVAIIGDAEQVRAGIDRYHEAGASEVVLTPMASAHYGPALLQQTAEAVAGQRPRTGTE